MFYVFVSIAENTSGHPCPARNVNEIKSLLRTRPAHTPAIKAWLKQRQMKQINNNYFCKLDKTPAPKNNNNTNTNNTNKNISNNKDNYKTNNHINQQHLRQ